MKPCIYNVSGHNTKIMETGPLFKQCLPNHLSVFAPEMRQWLPEDGLAHKPDILVVGKVVSGLMKVPASTEETLQKQGVEVIAANTGQAWGIFNEQVEKGKKVVGAFHLTC